MKHIKPVTVSGKYIPAQAQSGAGDIFLQIWFYIFGSILLGALGLK